MPSKLMVLELYNKNIVSLVLSNNSLRRVVTDGGVNIVDANASYNSSQYSFASSFGYLSNIGDDIVFGPELTIGYNYFPKYNKNCANFDLLDFFY